MNSCFTPPSFPASLGVFPRKGLASVTASQVPRAGCLAGPSKCLRGFVSGRASGSSLADEVPFLAKSDCEMQELFDITTFYFASILDTNQI
jgi:hypothetical protein